MVKIMKCENCINFIAIGTECLEGHYCDGNSLEGYDCNDWLYGGEE